MKARAKIYSQTGQTYLGTLPTQGLRFSHAVGGSGDISFTAKQSTVDALGATNCTLRLELETSPGVWTECAQPYAIRPPARRQRVGDGLTQLTGTSLLDAWSLETVFFPEYVNGTILQGSSDTRGLGWMSSAYDPGSDPREDWDLLVVDDRAWMPTDGEWPAGTGADWITASGLNENTYRKLFLSSFTISGTARKAIRAYFSSDEAATLWIAGEQVLITDDLETGYKYTHHADLVVEPGTYAVGIDTRTSITPGGNATDPVILAIATLDSNGAESDWILATGAGWYACRRDTEGPGSEPPGPTPGSLIKILVNEAADRSAAGWAYVDTSSFSTTVDSNGSAWPVCTERFVRNGMDTYKLFFDALAETESDIWLDNDLNLYAAPQQGVNNVSIVFDENNIVSMSDQETGDMGTVVVGLTLDGWVQRSVTGFRREFGLELGQAISKQMGWRICDAALADAGRWDGTIKFKVVAGKVPYIDFGVGDEITIDYRDVDRTARILSISAEAGEGGLQWSLEVTDESVDVGTAALASNTDGGETGVGGPGTLSTYTKPDSSNTGHTGTLTEHHGNLIITTPNTVIEDMDVFGNIQIRTSGVQILNSRVRGGTSGDALIDCRHVNCVDAYIEHCTLVPDYPSTTWNGIIGHDYTAKWNNIYGTVDGFGVYNTNTGHQTDLTNVLIESNWVHALYCKTPDPSHTDNRTHNDCVQIQGGGGVTILGNSFMANPGAGSSVGLSGTSCVMITPNVSACPDNVIEYNWMDYGGACINISAKNKGPTTTALVQYNQFGRNGGYRILIYNDLVCAGLPSVTGTDTANGNVYADNGDPVTVNRL